jgi:hypothetical protein
MDRSVASLVWGSLLLFTAVPRANAWGREGHRLTALVAEDHMTPVALADAKALLGGESIADIASWADDYRQDHRETAPWHYVNIPANALTYDRMRDCPAPPGKPDAVWRDCAVDRILEFEAELKDSATDPKEKAFALKMLVHLVGDLHQPLHAMGDARGGNDLPVNQFGEKLCGKGPCNLHGLWDDGLIEHRNLKEKNYVAALESEIRERDWEKLVNGSPVSWANTSHRLGVNSYVDPNTYIGEDYYRKNIGLVDEELALGGLELARILNAVFTTPASSQGKGTDLSVP